ncbi:hypothetical protein HOB95_00440 [bacterium]|nr:hypothetical protein [bacterium]
MVINGKFEWIRNVLWPRVGLAFLCLVFTLCSASVLADNGASVTVRATDLQHEATKIAFVVIRGGKALLTDFAQELAHAITYSKQCDVDLIRSKRTSVLRSHDTIKSSYLKKLEQQGYDFALVLHQIKREIEWSLYSVDDASFIGGKRIKINKKNVHAKALTVAQDNWQYLFSDRGPFMSQIAYCVKQGSGGQVIKRIYRADFDGSNPRLVVGMPTINVAPRWNDDSDYPLLYYSEMAATNVRLMASNMDGKRRLICDMDGLNMLASFAGNDVAFCLSAGGTSQVYLYKDASGKGKRFVQITHNKGNNIYPQLLAGGDIIFCSDFESRSPKIYRYYSKNKDVSRLVSGNGFFASPAYSTVTDSVAYTKLVAGVSQLFVHDCTTGKSRQLTSSKGHKEECAWSPCGSFLVFSVSKSRSSRIAMMHVPTKRWWYVSPKNQECSYPTWSGYFNRYF